MTELLNSALGGLIERLGQHRAVSVEAHFTHAQDLITFAGGMGCADTPVQISPGRLTGTVARWNLGELELAYETSDRELVFHETSEVNAACISHTADGRLEWLSDTNLVSRPAGSHSVYLLATPRSVSTGRVTASYRPRRVPSDGEFWAAVRTLTKQTEATSHTAGAPMQMLLQTAEVLTILDTFAAHLHGAVPAVRKRSGGALTRLMTLADERAVFRIDDLVGDLQMSRRNLHYYTTRHLGVAPKRLVKSMGLRNVILAIPGAALAGKSIGDLAFEHGFHNFSQFCADYRQLFGERPSDTFRRYGHC